MTNHLATVWQEFLQWCDDLPSGYLLCAISALLGGAAIWGWIRWARRSARVRRAQAEPSGNLKPPGLTVRGRLHNLLGHLQWGTGAVAALLLAVAFGINAYAGYIPSFSSIGTYTGSVPTFEAGQPATRGLSSETEQDREGLGEAFSERGSIRQDMIPSTSRDVPASEAMLYLPPGYFTSTTRYPVLYALHGSPGATPDWFVAGQAQRVLNRMIERHQIRPCILLTAQVTAGAHELDEPLNEPSGPQYEHFVAHDMVHWADRHLRTFRHADDRTILGMSSGGLAALAIGVHHPSVFGRVVSLLPYLHPYTKLIVRNPQALTKNSPVSEAAAYPAVAGQRFFLGQDGPGAHNAQVIQTALRQSGRPVRLRIYPNQRHTWAAVRAMLPSVLRWDAHPVRTRNASQSHHTA